MSNYTITIRNEFDFNGTTVVFVQPSCKATGALRAMEVYAVVDGIEMFQGYFADDFSLTEQAELMTALSRSQEAAEAAKRARIANLTF